MILTEALTQLRVWCDASGGEPIEIAPGRQVVFLSSNTFSAPDICRIEDQVGCALPDGYRLFLGAIGRSALFSSSRIGGGLHFYDPDRVIEVSLSSNAGNEEHVRERFCFIGEHRLMGDFMGFCINRPGPKNFDVFCHEYPLEEYSAISDEISSWRSFEEWLVHVVESRERRRRPALHQPQVYTTVTPRGAGLLYYRTS
jgi:hypothetical protein